MNITIRYLERGQPEPTSLNLAPVDYFDPLDPGENWEDDGVPRFNHAVDYLPTGLDLAWTELEESADAGLTRTREVISADHLVTHWHRTDPGGSEELCICSQLSPDTTHITRLCRGASEPWQLAFISVITDLPDGSQRENLLYSPSRPPSGAV